MTGYVYGSGTEYVLLPCTSRFGISSRLWEQQRGAGLRLPQPCRNYALALLPALALDSLDNVRFRMLLRGADLSEPAITSVAPDLG
jgi:hypothetical protein